MWFLAHKYLGLPPCYRERVNMSDDDETCPHCHKDTLEYSAQWGKRVLAIVEELTSPWKIFANIAAPHARQALQNMKVTRAQYRCRSCGRLAFTCPHCKNNSKLSNAAGQGDVRECSRCGRKSVFRLD